MTCVLFGNHLQICFSDFHLPKFENPFTKRFVLQSDLFCSWAVNLHAHPKHFPSRDGGEGVVYPRCKAKLLCAGGCSVGSFVEVGLAMDEEAGVGAEAQGDFRRHLEGLFTEGADTSLR